MKWIRIWIFYGFQRTVAENNIFYIHQVTVSPRRCAFTIICYGYIFLIYDFDDKDISPHQKQNLLQEKVSLKRNFSPVNGLKQHEFQ